MFDVKPNIHLNLSYSMYQCVIRAAIAGLIAWALVSIAMRFVGESVSHSAQIVKKISA